MTGKADKVSGIEPIFAISYVRTVMDNTKMIEANPFFERVAKERGFYSAELMEKIANANSLHDIKEVPEDIKKYFVTAHDITPEWHVKMQAAFQKSTDNAVSKTVNFSHNATRDDVRMAYLLAYKEGCKGLTVYRDGSRDEQVLSTGGKKAETVPTASTTTAEVALPHKIIPRARPSVTHGRTHKVSTGCGSLYVTINEDEHGICELFAQMGKSGGCAASQSEATSRLISLSLRSGIGLEVILKQIKGIRCPSPLWDKGNMVLSCPDAIAKAIERHLSNGSKHKKHIEEGVNGAPSRVIPPASKTKDLAGICPDCENVLEYVEDCVLCRSCGYSKCG